MDKITELLTRGVDTIYPTKEELEKVLRSGKKLTLYQGFDPTGTQLHIGHLVGLRKLAQWQKLGHKVIFLIGDFTATIGDPTGKTIARKVLTKEEVLKNGENYKSQVGKILQFDGENPVIVKFNSAWLSHMSSAEFMSLTSLISYKQVIERDMFQERIKNNESIGVLELLYPILQGYDSVAMDVDLEVGGTDQTFNMLMGRDLMLKLKKKEKFVMTTPLLTDSEGKKIGKTEGNVIALNDKPEELFGKIMALPDDIILKGFTYLTDVPMEKIEYMEDAMHDGENPVLFKKQLAFEIVKQLNNEEEAQKAQEEFERVVQKKEMPTEMKVFPFPSSFISGASITNILTTSGTVSSNSEARRVIEQGGVTVNDHLVTNPNEPFINYLKEGTAIVKKGKNFYIKILEEKK